MTTDQTLHLLAVLAWPTVSIIGLIAAWRVALAIEYAADRAADTSRQIIGDRAHWLDLISGWLHNALPALVRAATFQPRNQHERLAETCERSLLTILGTNGGFPAAEGDDVCRQLVREVRKMYAELAHPTPAPARTAKSPGTGQSPFADEFAEFADFDTDEGSDADADADAETGTEVSDAD